MKAPDPRFKLVTRDDLLREFGGLDDDRAVELVASSKDLLTRAYELAGTETASFTSEVLAEKRRMQVRRRAEELLRSEANPPAELPRLVSLSAFLAEPEEDTKFRVEGLWPVGGHVMLSAPAKSGKTTVTGNLLRSLADGEDFLGRFPTEPVGRIVLVDDEMSEGQLRSWLRDHGIRNTDAIDVVLLRGSLSSFNILDAETRSRWAAYLGKADVLIFDCLRPALDALGLDENHDGGRFLTALNELVGEAGISELLVVHHMGHGAERARGDSGMLGWGDSHWRLLFTRDAEGRADEFGPRYFTARGRHEDVPELQLAYDIDTRHLTVSGGSRAEAANTEIDARVLEYVAEAETPPTRTGLGDALVAEGFPRRSIHDSRERMVRRGLLEERPRTGRGGGHEYVVPEPFTPEEGEVP